MDDNFGLSGSEIMMDVQRVVCPVHCEPFRELWPPTPPMIVSLVELFQAVTGNEGPDSLWTAVREKCGEERPEGFRINEVTVDRPLCYFATADQIRAMYAKSDVGRLGRCNECRRTGITAVCSWTTEVGLLQAPMCFSCIHEEGLRYHRVHPKLPKSARPAR
jgi:hypothetical protein